VYAVYTKSQPQVKKKLEKALARLEKTKKYFKTKAYGFYIAIILQGIKTEKGGGCDLF